ncbi:MAG: nucleotidyl transferase AbiEii/AbiGii toxin family protein [Candidatus Absconditabacteria bacterium]|nr:nucleotidyl transferase AbiEii/AbiGii toxin family protein [Candidatus Absconditabacteria bacterium]
MLNTDQHRTIMFNLIKDIFNSNIGKYLAFKGGTATYFLHKLDRFSTDLDFDLLDDSKHIDEELAKIAQKYGTIKKGNKLTLSYGDYDVNIKIDVNRVIWENNRYEILNFYGTDIKAQDKGTIFANKLVALIQRHTNRDIYDINFFFNNSFPINEEVIKERTGNDLNTLLNKIKEKLENLPKEYKILDGLGEVLDEEQKKFVKNNLISSLIGIIQMKLDFE